MCLDPRARAAEGRGSPLSAGSHSGIWGGAISASETDRDGLMRLGRSEAARLHDGVEVRALDPNPTPDMDRCRRCTAPQHPAGFPKHVALLPAGRSPAKRLRSDLMASAT